MSIERNVKTVLENVAQAAVLCGRNEDEITVLAASKMNDAEKVREAISAGISYFGENRVQELMQKYSQGAYTDAHLHFIGHLQKNKVKDIIGKAELIHSVDSPELASVIAKKSRALGITTNVLIEVNIGGEESKSGVSPDGLDTLAAQMSELVGIHVSGLMAIPPAGGTELQNRNYFDSMYKLFVDMNSKKYDNVNMTFLSMGMSSDYRQAILSGANLVRIGTAIFGARDYTNK